MLLINNVRNYQWNCWEENVFVKNILFDFINTADIARYSMDSSFSFLRKSKTPDSRTQFKNLLSFFFLIHGIELKHSFHIIIVHPYRNYLPRAHEYFVLSWICCQTKRFKYFRIYLSYWHTTTFRFITGYQVMSTHVHHQVELKTTENEWKENSKYIYIKIHAHSHKVTHRVRDPLCALLHILDVFFAHALSYS